MVEVVTSAVEVAVTIDLVTSHAMFNVVSTNRNTSSLSAVSYPQQNLWGGVEGEISMPDLSTYNYSGLL